MQSIWRAKKCKIPVCRRTQIHKKGSFYPGPLPIGIVAGIVLLIQIDVLILCIRNILTFRFQWGIALTMLMSGFSILGTGFFFIGWFLVFIA